jgi:hypothetical protein
MNLALASARMRRVLLVLALLGLAAGAASAASRPEPWPAPADPMALAQKAGLKPETYEHLTYHVHAHLDVFLNGAHVIVPAGIGIDTQNKAVHRFVLPDGSVGWGGIQPPCKQPCISPLHTHAIDGILHTESSTATPNTLGAFFVEWGVPLSSGCVGHYCKNVAIYVDGKPFSGDPRAIKLTNHLEIAVVIGTPPKAIPSSFPKNAVV